MDTSTRTLWPTPCAGDAKSSGSRNTPTSQAHFGVSLTDAVRGDAGMGRRWPMPTGRDWKDGSAEACANVPVNGLLGRTVHVSSRQEAPATGSLNPTFVEWLMGYPQDWTVL
ncbi:MAG TPA: hypothetical protein VKE26_26150 [Xanthobacteraceae bacterium]|nr:hypothetical protein [Xanthobacteraceae bacterium]